LKESNIRGEWRVQMELTEPYFVLGKHAKCETLVFLVAAIHNTTNILERYVTDAAKMTSGLHLVKCVYAVNEKI
jgi:hypothetical protein